MMMVQALFSIFFLKKTRTLMPLSFSEYQIMKSFSAMLCQNIFPQKKNEVMKLSKNFNHRNLDDMCQKLCRFI